MARQTIRTKGIEEFVLMLNNLGGSEADEIAKRALYEGMKPIADRIKGNLRGVLSGKGSGDLLNSFGISKMRKSKDGYNVSAGFSGYDRTGTPNAVKARVLESGSSRQPKRPFSRPAVNATRGLALQNVKRVIDEEIKKRSK